MTGVGIGMGVGMSVGMSVGLEVGVGDGIAVFVVSVIPVSEIVFVSCFTYKLQADVTAIAHTMIVIAVQKPNLFFDLISFVLPMFRTSCRDVSAQVHNRYIATV